MMEEKGRGGEGEKNKGTGEYGIHEVRETGAR